MLVRAGAESRSIDLVQEAAGTVGWGCLGQGCSCQGCLCQGCSRQCCRAHGKQLFLHEPAGRSWAEMGFVLASASEGGAAITLFVISWDDSQIKASEGPAE